MGPVDRGKRGEVPGDATRERLLVDFGGSCTRPPASMFENN